jgi:hypothetical protein
MEMAKMIPIETVAGMWGEETNKNGGGGEFKYDISDIF